MAAATTPFWPIFPAKSDGKSTVVQKGRSVDNGPSKEQLDRTPNAQGQCDYYRLIEYDEAKHLDWRKKLGGMLVREVGGQAHQDKWQQCVLWDFPEGYRLYEHIKSKADGQAKAVKNHSGGGHDRQDAYLYGHPKGQKKRFRSPVEFFPHLLWLTTDDTNDPENCTCKLCSPLQLEPEKAAVATKETGRQSPIVQIPVRRPSIPQASQSPAVRAAANPAQAAPQPHPSQLPSRPAANTPMARPSTSTPAPTPLPQPRTIDQQVDSQYNKLHARVGEITWFLREGNGHDGNSWGLGVIIRRWLPKDGSSAQAYIVQALSYPDATPPPQVQIVTDPNKIKPWLAWSAPGCTYDWLEQRQQQNPLPFHQVPWKALDSGQLGKGIAEVDASILASKMVDNTYTLFEKVRTTKSPTSQEERHWNGIFLGAEKIWNGEPVRIHVGSGNDVMVVTDIIERITPPASTNSPPRHAVQFVGDVYNIAQLPAPDTNNPPNPPPTPHLPIRMREDMRWRNQSLIPVARTMTYWKLSASQASLDISEIKGRWFEHSLFFPNYFHDCVKKGETGINLAMNVRGACNNATKTVGIRTEDRISAFGASVPKGTVLVDGIEPPSQAAPPPAQQPQLPTAQQLPTVGAHDMPGLDQGAYGGQDNPFVLDDYMNLDHMGEDSIAFDQPFFDQGNTWPS